MEYGCIGEKLGHSFSKEIHAYLADYNYELCELPPESVGEFIKSRKFKAINVTIPYKQTVIPFLDEIDPVAAEIGAVNTVVNRGGKLYGYNTDFAGMRALIKKGGIALEGKKVLILGSGGTSKTAFAVAKSEKAAIIYRVSRSGKDGCITYETAQSEHRDADIIINTTPCGMFPNIDESAIDLADFPQIKGVVDAVYNPLRSVLVQQGEKLGIPAIGGLYMLVMQAAEAVKHFTGKEISDDLIEDCFNKIYYSKQNLVLIGMPGCGKSTLGKSMAQRLDMNFIDTDAQIVKSEQKDIPQIFSNVGEQGFRKIESNVIERICAIQNTVIATGGGAILDDKNLRFLRANGRICFLDRPLEKLAVTADRPLSSDREKLKKLYNERYNIYCSSADFIVKCQDEINENLSMIEKGFKI